MNYPSLVYISPGDHQCPGGTFSYRSVLSESDVEAAAKAGYYPTIDLALSKPVDFDWGEYLGYGKAPELKEEHQDEQEPTRAELEQRAEELGIGFNARTKDATLIERIKAAEADV